MPDRSSGSGSSVVKLRPEAPPAQQPAPEPSPPASNAGYISTPQEKHALERRRSRKSKKSLVPKLKIEMKDGIAMTSVDHPDQDIGLALLMEALGIENVTILKDYLSGLARCCTIEGKTDEPALNFMVQSIAAMAPKDMAEAMLFAHMVAVHQSTMFYAGRLLTSNAGAEVRESYERSLNKLARTYAAQLTTMKQYRSDGKQKIVVKHVTVHDGGRAIVGDVTHGVPPEGMPENSEATA